MALQAGVSRCVITPPVGIALVGFAGRGPAQRVHDDLFATTLALEDDGARAVITSLDLIGVSTRLAAEVREIIEQRTGVPGKNVILCCSHTHYGPATGAYEPDDLPSIEAAYVSSLKFFLAGSAEVALSELRPVTMGVGTGESHIGVNRRERRPDGEIILGQNPNGACDREVIVLRLDTTAGRPLAAVVNFACHPVSPGGSMQQISADFVAGMRTLAETSTGAKCVFLQGAAGNINPVEMQASFEPARRLGVILGGEVAKVFESTSTKPAGGLAIEAAFADLPALSFPSAEEGKRVVEELRRQLEEVRSSRASSGAIFWAESRLGHAEGRLESIIAERPLPHIAAEMTAIRFGGAAIVTAPGEIFCETGMDVKRQSPVGHTCFVGYTNGTIGYVPTPESYPEGGYEVTHGCRVNPEAAGIIRDTALQLLERVK